MLATYENQLTQDDAVPESGRALDTKRQELAVSLGTRGLQSRSLRCSHHTTSGQVRDEAPRPTAAPLSRLGCLQGAQLEVAIGGPWHKSLGQLLRGFVWLVGIRC